MPAPAPKLSTQTLLVIGGTSGIGLAVAHLALANSIAHVTISGSNPTRLAAALASLRASDPAADLTSRTSGHVCDLSSPATTEPNLRALLAATVAANGAGTLDHVVFTAGDALAVVPVADLTVAALHAAGAVRFVAPLLLAKLLPAFAAPGHASSLTLTGGVNGQRPAPGWTVPAAYGNALRGVVRGLAVDLKPLRVNLVEPGAVETPLWDRFAVGGVEREAFRRRWAERTTVGRVGAPEDTAEAYLYLMKDHFAAGSVVSSNGGTLLV
ncbi:Short-chain dehydrogenase/reductase SDR [Neofusicoccum parvum]|nr:Short-chain dehydrogenase/reductase SDR [Neofusicoccum parvum]